MPPYTVLGAYRCQQVGVRTLLVVVQRLCAAPGLVPSV